jgi:hypothetical protein
MVLAILVAWFASERVAGALRTTRSVAVVLVFGLGFIAAATLTPTLGGLSSLADGPPVPAGTCDLSRLRPISPVRLLSVNQASSNVFLFVPLGIAVVLLPRSRRRAMVATGAAALPFVIEATQLLLPALGRECQGSDVVDNLTGLAIGAGTVILVRSLRMRLAPGSPSGS